MKRKNVTLRRQFVINILAVLLIVVSCTGAIQLFLMKDQIDTQTTQQAEALASSVLMGIEQTDLAKKTIEQQIDLKLESTSNHIGTLLQGKTVEEITTNDLIDIQENFHLAGLTIFQETESKDDIMGIKATDEQEVGFSFKEFGYYEVGKMLLNGEKPTVPGATLAKENILVLPIAPSGSNEGEMKLYKYAYYHIQGTDYVINPYIEANEVYDYTETVGPNEAIQKILNENSLVEEIAVLNPRVFANPALEEQLYPPLEKVDAGQFDLKTSKDEQFLKESITETKSYIETVGGKEVYKMFLPYDENRVVYLALDYEEMTAPLYRHSIILIVSGVIALIVLIILTTRFFNRVYENIQKIKAQIGLIEEGDLTAKSDISDKSELEALSKKTNLMVDKLNKLVTNTQEQASKTQSLSMLLESEAAESVEKMYGLSTETTINSRERLYEVTGFISDVEQILQPYSEHDQKAKEALNGIETLKEAANNHTSATTNMTIQLSDLLQSLHDQSSELSDISNTLLKRMSKFKL